MRLTTLLRFKAVSGPGILLYAFTISFAAIDWVMSLDPSWISTIYGLLILIGQLLSALCFRDCGGTNSFHATSPMSELLKPEQVHDHGKFMLAFIMVWAYFSFSQWLIIWAGNLPEEITWYIRRLNGGWGFVGLRAGDCSTLPCRSCLLLSRSVEARHHQAGLAGGVDDADALGGFVLDH